MNSIPISYSNRLVFKYLSATNRRFDEPRKKPSWQRPSPTKNVNYTPTPSTWRCAKSAQSAHPEMLQNTTKTKRPTTSLLEPYAGANVHGNLAGIHVLPLVYHVAAVRLDVLLNGVHKAQVIEKIFRGNKAVI